MNNSEIASLSSLKWAMEQKSKSKLYQFFTFVRLQGIKNLTRYIINSESAKIDTITQRINDQRKPLILSKM